MYNHRTIKTIRGTTPARHDTAFWAWKGYTDCIGGLGFDPDYNTLPPNNQRNYERGRQVAAWFIGVQGAAPKWRKTERMRTVLNRALGWREMAALTNDISPLFFSK